MHISPTPYETPKALTSKTLRFYQSLREGQQKVVTIYQLVKELVHFYNNAQKN